jgi:hypothetical protein
MSVIYIWVLAGVSIGPMCIITLEKLKDTFSHSQDPLFFSQVPFDG